MNQTLITAGEFFHDLIFYDLEDLPAFGEELKTDRFETSIGGGAPITAVAAALLGRKTELVTVRGDSALDLDARDRLAAAGITENRTVIRPGQRSGLTVAVSARHDRFFLTCPGINGDVEGHLLRGETFQGLAPGTHIHFALTPSDWASFQDLIDRLRAEGLTSSWDLGWDPQAAQGQAFARLRASLDILFLNEHEAIRYTQSEDLEQALARLSRQPNIVVVKLGSQGAVACSGGVRFNSPPVEVEALETTGAGDAFNGGFLHGWMDRRPLEECLLAGNICGACSTRRPGGTTSLPDREEFESYWQKLTNSTTQ